MIAHTQDRKKLSASKERITNVINSLKPIFIVEHIYGLWSFRTQDELLLPSSWKQKIYGIFIAAVNAALVLALNILLSYLDDSKIIGIFYMVPCLVILIQHTLALIFTTLIFNKAYRALYHTFADLDSRLKTDDKFYQRASTKTKKWLFILIVTHVCSWLFDLPSNCPPDPRDILFMIMLFEQKVENLAFCLIIEMLRSRLEIINNYLMKLHQEPDEMTPVFTVNTSKNGLTAPNTIGRLSKDNMKISDLAMMYDTIGSICSMANRMFNFQVFMTLVSAFCYIVIAIWTSLYYYKNPENHYGALIAVIIWCMTTLMMVGTMCLVCERLLSMRSSTRVLVNELIMDYSLPKAMRVQAKAFMELIEAWPLRILIYDMFSVDISLLLKFISVSTTYLIVIIQVSHFG